MRVVHVLVVLADCLRVRPALWEMGFGFQKGKDYERNLSDVDVGVVRDLTSAFMPWRNCQPKDEVVEFEPFC